MKTEVWVTEEVEYIKYHCPGCKHLHYVPTKRWHWNGDREKPTLSPSVRHFIPANEYGPEKTICHYHLRNGILEFCGDCDHDLKGKNVPLPDLPEENR